MEMYPGKQTFIDDFFIESLAGAHRVLNCADKITVDEPLHTVNPDRSWESTAAQGPIIYDEKNHTFRMYYTGVNSVICVLESSDGVHWERPNLGVVEFEGSKNNNIISWPSDCPSLGNIFYDPHETAETYQWKRITTMPHEGVWQALYSADGYNWCHYPAGLHNHQKQFFAFGSPAETFGGTIDPDAPYILYSQRGSSRRTRVLGRRDSQDGLNWSGLRTVIDQDLDDPPGTEFYAAGHDIASRTDGGLHIIMLNVFFTDLTEPYAIEQPKLYWGNEVGSPALPARVDGVVEPQLAVSRDTVSWKRYRQPFIPRGKPGAWDWGSMYVSGPIHHNEMLWFYYNGVGVTHNNRTPQLHHTLNPKENQTGIGAAQLRPDGYISVESDSYAPGILTTHRFRQESGGRVTVNVDATAGELRYEVLEDTGAPIAGFTVADCDPVRGDALNSVLSWNGVAGWPGVSEERQSSYPNLPKREFYIKLRFYVSPGTKLYSLTLDPPEVTMWQVRSQSVPE